MSLAISRKDIIDAVTRGAEINVDTLKMLIRIAQTKEEESEILTFDGDPTRLADTEPFLYQLLKSVPSTFTRFNAMLFKSNFELETPHLQESFQILDLVCKELRVRGLLLKLLEAILKAGNSINAGTLRETKVAIVVAQILNQEKEYKMLGLSIGGSLCAKFSNVKKAASIDYDGLVKTSASLAAQIADITKLVQQCNRDRENLLNSLPFTPSRRIAFLPN